MIEQRKNQRFDLRLPLELLGSAAASESSGETRNMSSCGVLFTCDRGFDIGESIEYMITLPKAPGTRAEVRLRCVGKIVRNTEDSSIAATLERYEFVRGKG